MIIKLVNKSERSVHAESNGQTLARATKADCGSYVGFWTVNDYTGEVMASMIRHHDDMRLILRRCGNRVAAGMLLEAAKKKPLRKAKKKAGK